MSSYTVDAYGWIEYLDGTKKGELVKKIVENTENKIYTSSVTYAEVISKFIRTQKDPLVANDAIHALSKITSPNAQIAFLAAKIHAENRERKPDFGLADAFVIATAKILLTKIITGDLKHFSDVPNTILLK